MPDRLTPNPYSPYADAHSGYRHLVVGFLGALPPAGSLAVAACGGMAVVPDGRLSDATDALSRGSLNDLPPGLCPLCVAVATGERDEPSGVRGICRECGTGSSHFDLCAVCRQELHDEWWPTRDKEAPDE